MSIENIEMQKQQVSLDNDLNKLVEKYIKIMDWDIPEIDEAKARRLILDEIQQAVARLQV